MIRLSLFDSTVCQHLATALAHFLWEGVTIAAVVAVIAALLRRHSARSRYGAYLLAMLLMAACLPITLAYVVATAPAAAVSDGGASGNHLEVIRGAGDSGGAVAALDIAPAMGSNAITESPAVTMTLDVDRSQAVRANDVPSASPLWHVVAPYLVTTYLLGLSVMLLRVVASLYGGHRLRRASIAVDQDDLLAVIRRVAARIGLRRVPMVAYCQRVSGPVVIGVLRPAVLLPVTLTSGLTPQQLEAILTHELAHLRRFDHLVLMMQRLIEAVLFFHPAVWYVSRCLSAERENCCDDAVIASGAPRLAYAELLLRLAEQQVCGQPVPTALAAGESPSRLRRRVARLFDTPPEPAIRLGRSGTILVICLLAAMILPPALSYVLADPAVESGPHQAAAADNGLAADAESREGLQREALGNLRAMVRERLAQQSSIDAVERAAGELTKRHTDRAHLGVIHAEVAAWFYFKGHDTQAANWALSARSFSLSVEDRLRMFEYWGDAARAKYEGQVSYEAAMHSILPNFLGLGVAAGHLAQFEEPGELATQRRRLLTVCNTLADNTGLVFVQDLEVAKAVSRYLRKFPEMAFVHDTNAVLQREPWIPAQVASYDTMQIDLKQLCESLLSPDGLFLGGSEEFQIVTDVVASLRSDPNGPRLDVRTDLIRHLGRRLTVISDYSPDRSAHRLLAGLALKNEQAFTASLIKSAAEDPTWRQTMNNGQRVWQSRSAAGDTWVIAVAHGYLLMTHDMDLMDKVLSSGQERRGDGPAEQGAAAPAPGGQAAGAAAGDEIESKWGEPLEGLRMRLSAPRGRQYRRGVILPLLVEMQNVTDQPIPFADLHRDCDFKVFTATDAWLGMARTGVSISPWEGAAGSLGPGQTIRWQVRFDRFLLNKPAAAGSTVSVLVSVPKQIEEPGKLPRTSYSAPVSLKLVDAPPAVRSAQRDRWQLGAQDVSDTWTEKMDVVYREVGGLFLRSLAIHIDGQGKVTMVNCGAPGRIETSLDRERLDRLAARLREMKVWEIGHVDWAKTPPATDSGEVRIALTSGGRSIVRDYANKLMRTNATLRAFQAEMLAIIDEARQAAASDRSRKAVDQTTDDATQGEPQKTPPAKRAITTVNEQVAPQHLARISREGQPEPVIVWGKPRNGLAVGIGEIRTSLKSPRRPIIHAYLENRGEVPIQGAVQSRARYVVELDQQYFVEADFGGPVGLIAPGKRLGPIVVSTAHFNKVKQLEADSTIDQTTPGPILTGGDHTLRLHFKTDGQGLVAGSMVPFSVSLEPYPVNESVAMIVAELAHADRDIRRGAALAAGKLRLPGYRAALVDVLHDKDKVIRRYAAESLGQLGDRGATTPLRGLLRDDEMEVRLAAAESLVKLGVPLEPGWVEPIITSKHRVFQNAIWLVRRHGGKQAVPTLIRCLDGDDPSVNSYYNYTLVWQIHACGGPDLKYVHDFDAEGTPAQVQGNRQVLSQLKALIDQPELGTTDPDQAQAAVQGPRPDGPSDVLAAYLDSRGKHRAQHARAVEIINNAQVVFLSYERVGVAEEISKQVAFAQSLQGSSIVPISRSVVSGALPPTGPQKVDKSYAAIEAVFSKFFGPAEGLTSDEWLVQMRRPIAAGYQLKSVNVVSTPSAAIMKESFAASQAVMRSVAEKLAALKQGSRQLHALTAAHHEAGNLADGKWPDYPRVMYEHDVGANTKYGRQKLSDDWCHLSMGFAPIKGFPVQLARPGRVYPMQGIEAGWSIESGDDPLNKKFQEIVLEALRELDALEAELADGEHAARRDD